MVPRMSVTAVRATAIVVIRLKNSQVAYVQRNVGAMNMDAQPTSTRTATTRNSNIRILNSLRTEIQP